MEIEAVGGTTTTQTDTNNAISQDEFIKLFLAQLNFQDPLEPVDNREFLTQMASFSQLELERQQDSKLGALLQFASGDQTISLLGKSIDVEINGAKSSGTVTGVHSSTVGTTLTITQNDGIVLSDVLLEHVSVIR